MPKRTIELTKHITRHSLCGLDLSDLKDSNLIELGINSIHDRNVVRRAL